MNIFVWFFAAGGCAAVPVLYWHINSNTGNLEDQASAILLDKTGDASGIEGSLVDEPSKYAAAAAPGNIV